MTPNRLTINNFNRLFRAALLLTECLWGNTGVTIGSVSGRFPQRLRWSQGGDGWSTENEHSWNRVGRFK